MSTTGPQLEKEAFSSVRVEAPTVIAEGVLAGLEPPASIKPFPAATTVVTPEETRLGGHEFTDQAHGSNRRATTAFSRASDPVDSGNAVGNVNTDPGEGMLHEKATHTSAQVPDL